MPSAPEVVFQFRYIDRGFVVIVVVAIFIVIE
jgi:hypothetical protein